MATITSDYLVSKMTPGNALSYLTLRSYAGMQADDGNIGMQVTLPALLVYSGVHHGVPTLVPRW